MDERVAFTHAATVVVVFVFRNISLNIVKRVTNLKLDTFLRIDKFVFFKLINKRFTLIDIHVLIT